MKAEQIKQLITTEFPRLLRQNLMSFSNLTIAPHKHNGVDAPQIPMNNILIQNVIQLPSTALITPVAGMIAFDGTNFWVCKVTGTWTLLI